MSMSLENDLSSVSASVRALLDRRPGHFIDGGWVAAGHHLPVIDPSSARQVSEIGRGGADEIDAAVRAAQKALRAPAWAGLGPVGREALLHRLADLIALRAPELSVIESIDNGMPLWFSDGLDVGGAVGVYRYFAGWPTKLAGQSMEMSAPPGLGSFFGYTRREPVGVVGAIVPWNVPFMMAAWKLAPALAAGCTVVLKPAEDTSLSALILADLIIEAGFPPGVVNIVTGTGPEAGEALVRHKDVAKISFTGSTATGRRIGSLAGESLKKVTLELGGKSPTLIFDDADIDRAVENAAMSIFLNSGQICVAGSRLYAEEGVFDEVVDRLQQHALTLKLGPALGAAANMGPLINARQRAKVTGYIDAARNSGCEVASGADVSGTAGFYVSPTIVVGAKQSDAITQEEIFGPVLSVYRFKGEDEAIAVANGTRYGLAATIHVSDIGRAMRIAAALECGKVSINGGGFPYPALPEGGYKGSGHGRDLGRESVESFLQTKTVVVRTD
jgi:phenylacetaldehyde dehydrogenase